MAENSGRMRAYMACEPCRERKKKCDGRRPCSLCVRFGYDCSFECQNRKRRKGRQEPPPATPSPAMAMNMESSGLEARARSTEANSGAAFVRRLGLNTDAANAKKLQTFAWNVGRCNSFVFSPAPLSFAQIVTRTELISLVQTYFEKFHPFYGFIDLDHS